jgi:hypothetical protein
MSRFRGLARTVLDVAGGASGGRTSMTAAVVSAAIAGGGTVSGARKR